MQEETMSAADDAAIGDAVQLRRYAVFGQPIAHSQSPAIHAMFARQFGIPLRYDAIEAGVDTFADALARFAADGGVGANVTLPLKETAVALCTELGDAARIAGAVNTLTRQGHGWRGDNTDGDGLVRDITDHLGQDLRGRRTLLLGAGGAARGVAPALIDAGVEELVITNRTPERADALADRIGQPRRAHSRYWGDLGNSGSFDLIVNATSAGRGDTMLDLTPRLVGMRTLCYDLSYGEAAAGFLAWARTAGALLAVDGLGMLIEQAASAFERWHGRRPDTAPVHAALRARAQALHTAD